MTDSTEWLRRINAGEKIAPPTDDADGKLPERVVRLTSPFLGRAMALMHAVGEVIDYELRQEDGRPPRAHNHDTETLRPAGDCGRCDWLRSRMEAQ